MKLTLYKNCMLNNKYQEVFYENVLPEYLNSLNKREVTVNNSYYETNMEFVIDYEMLISLLQGYENIYEFNYIKVEDWIRSYTTPDFVRYCFIKSINVKHGCVYIEIEEDIWANYYPLIKGTNVCILTGSRRKVYDEGAILSLLSLPYDYDGNNLLELKSISYPNPAIGPKIYMLVEFQLYDVVTFQEPNADREVFYALVRYDNQPYNASFGQLETNSRLLMENMPQGLISGKNYQIGNIYGIPENLININDFESTETSIPGSMYIKKSLYPKESVVLSSYLANDYKNLFIGTLGNYINLVNNGTEIDYKVTFTCCSAGVSLKLNCSNQIIDIIDSFKYDVPFQSILSEEYATRSVASSLKSYTAYVKGDMSNNQGWVNIGGSLVDLLGIASGNFMGAVATAYKDLASGVQKLEGVGGSEYQIYDAEKWAANAPKYSNSKGVIKNLETVVNILFGLVVGKIEPDNANFVKSFVDNFGYKCFQFVDNYWLTLLLQTNLYSENYFHFNVIKFSSPNVYGSFTNEIAMQLNNILEKGVKIWYTKTFSDDGYTDDLI